jgi:type IV secretory pathway VirJ component
MSVRKILLTTTTALVLLTGGLMVTRDGLGSPADAAPVPTPAVTPMTNAPMTETPFHYGSVGATTIFRRGAEPGRFVILISDKTGWTPVMTDLARQLTASDATVVGVDLPRFLAAAQREAGNHGLYPAGDFSELAQAAQKALKFAGYHKPILVGQGAGAALAYGTLAQSPAGIFQGGVALDFTPVLATGHPLLAGDGGLTHVVASNGFAYQPEGKLSGPFVALQATNTAHDFFGTIPSARLQTLVVGDALAPQVGRALTSVAPEAAPPRVSTAQLAGLPLVEVPAAPGGDTLAVFYSGDGGWAGIDRGLAQGFVKAGVPVVGYDSLRYFWTKRTPQQAADDLTAVIRHYQAAWGKKRVVLAGYSFGADALPIIVQHLPADIRGQVRVVALLGTDSTGELEFHPGDWLNASAKDSYAIAPVLTALKDVPIVCIYGQQEHDDACPVFPAQVRKVGLPGDHHFNGDYDAVGRALKDAAGL